MPASLKHNLSRIDSFMIAEYFSSSDKYSASEIRGLKSLRAGRETYGDAAVGYVQIQHTQNICTIKCKICHEHKVKQKNYIVIVKVDESEEVVMSADCQDCEASAGGCKHAVAFIMWLHRRSEEPSTTDVQCYWKKSKLVGVGTAMKYITTKIFGNVKIQRSVPPNGECLKRFIDSGTKTKISRQLLKYFTPDTKLRSLGIHTLLMNFISSGGQKCVDDFLSYCKGQISADMCNMAFQATKDQSYSSLWYELRYGRITASRIYEATRCKTSSGSLVEAILGARLKETSAVRRGKLLEKEVITVLERNLNMKFCNVGLMLSQDYPILGASPDAVNDEFVVEVKCPSSQKTLKNYITIDNKITNKYKAQIQLQMYLLNRNHGIFCVADPDFENNSKIVVIVEGLDTDFIEPLIEMCTTFWKYNIFTQISNS